MKRVAVLVPPDRVEELRELAARWREDYRTKSREGSERSEGAYAPGGDAKAISRIAQQHFGGYREMFVAHDWPERGSDMVRKVQARVKEKYGSIAEFERQFPTTV